MGAVTAYVPRAVAPLELWAFGAIRVKPYLLRAAGRAADPARLVQARATVGRVLAEEAPGDALGFAILHLGEDADWLLADWWVNGDSLAQRLFAGSAEGGPFLPLAPRPLVACVWELAVIGHERAAFVAAMMNGGGGAEGYLSDRIEGAC